MKIKAILTKLKLTNKIPQGLLNKPLKKMEMMFPKMQRKLPPSQP